MKILMMSRVVRSCYALCMQRTIRCLIFLCGMVAGCDAVPETYVYAPPETEGGRLCVTHCLEAKSYCDEACDLPHRTCISAAQDKAVEAYNRYINRQFLTRQPMTRLLQSFEDTTACDKAGNDCRDDCEISYSACYANCGGRIVETTSCSFLCF